MCIESSSVFCEPILWTLFFAAAFCAVGYWLVSTGRISFKIRSETEEVTADIEVAEPELNQIEKELLKLGFEDLSLRSAVKYFELDGQVPFVIMGFYESDMIKIKLKLKNNRVVVFDLYMQDANTYEVENENNRHLIIKFKESDLNTNIYSKRFNTATELLNNIKWNDLIHRADIEVYTTREEINSIFD